ncbi:MAG: hypothetical protein NC433_04025 [Clostridiales bacterium]|nr:hypothetical protein [Clostridiales bacterium]
MKKKTLNKVLAAAVVGMMAANTPIDAKAAENEDIVAAESSTDSTESSTDSAEGSTTESAGGDNAEDSSDAGKEETEDSDSTDDSSENDETLSLEEAKENLEQAKQEEAAAKENVDNAQSAVDSAQAELDSAKQEAEDADSELKEAEDAENQAQIDKDSADSAVTAADEALKQAESDLDSALEEAGISKDEFEEVQNGIEDKKAEVNNAKQTVEQAQEDNDAKEQALVDAKAQAGEAANAVEQAQTQKDKADEQVSTAEAYVTTVQDALDEAESQTSADDILSTAKDAMDAAKAKLDKAQEQYNNGSLGFFQEMSKTENDANSSAAKAVEILTSTDDIRDNKGDNVPAWDTFRGYTHKGEENDATSLESMKATFDHIKRGNELRTSDELRPCDNNLLVTDYLMAVAQMNANWAANSGVIGHSQVFNIGENLAWGYYGGYYGTDPFAGWYYEEKEYYIADNNDSRAGHYTNITRSGWVITGFGVNFNDIHADGHNFKVAHSQEFGSTNSYSSNGTCYTVDEYEARFMAYYNKVTSELAAAQQAYDEAKTAYDNAYNNSSSAEQLIQNNIAQKKKELDNAKKALEDAKSEAAEMAAALTDAETLKATADANVVTAQSELDASSAKLDEANTALANANTAYDAALNVVSSNILDSYTKLSDANDEYDTAVAALEEAAAKYAQAQTDKANAEIRKTAADEAVVEKETVLADKNAVLTSAKKAYALAVANLAIAQADYDKLKPAEPSYTVSNVVSYDSDMSAVEDYNDTYVLNNNYVHIKNVSSGSVASFSKNCTFKFFLSKLESIAKENNTGALTIDCSTAPWFSMSVKQLNAIKERTGGELTVIFSYKGKKYTFTIPAGYDFSKLQDSKGWYGFMYLKHMFGGHEIV